MNGREEGRRGSSSARRVCTAWSDTRTHPPSLHSSHDAGSWYRTRCAGRRTPGGGLTPRRLTPEPPPTSSTAGSTPPRGRWWRLCARRWGPTGQQRAVGKDWGPTGMWACSSLLRRALGDGGLQVSSVFWGRNGGLQQPTGTGTGRWEPTGQHLSLACVREEVGHADRWWHLCARKMGAFGSAAGPGPQGGRWGDAAPSCLLHGEPAGCRVPPGRCLRVERLGVTSDLSAGSACRCPRGQHS
jgi:hypothetical protein